MPDGRDRNFAQDAYQQLHIFSWFRDFTYGFFMDLHMDFMGHLGILLRFYGPVFIVLIIVHEFFFNFQNFLTLW